MIFLQEIMLLTWRSLARSKWVSSVAAPAGAGPEVVDDPALSVYSTEAGARVNALKIATRPA
jgi:hypothetical protein